MRQGGIGIHGKEKNEKKKGKNMILKTDGVPHPKVSDSLLGSKLGIASAGKKIPTAINSASVLMAYLS